MTTTRRDRRWLAAPALAAVVVLAAPGAVQAAPAERWAPTTPEMTTPPTTTGTDSSGETTTPGNEESSPLVSSTDVPTSGSMTSTEVADALELPEDTEGCPAVQLIAVNGTTESGRNDSVSADTGWMAQVAQPAVQDANADGTERMSRAYTPYPASFGGFTDGEDETTYAESLEIGVENAEQLISETLDACPETKIFVSGYSQGAQVASEVTRDIGAGEGAAEPDQLAGTALMSDPTRETGSGVFSDPDQSSPGAVPGTTGTAVSNVDAAGAAPAAEGGGIAPNGAAADDFGAVSDRVASFCVPGDLACDTPEDSPILRLVANIAGTSTVDELHSDPVRALTDVGTVTGHSVLFSAVDTVNEDINFDSEQGFTIDPATEDTSTIARMAEYSDPTLNPEDRMDSVVRAGSKLAGMGLGATITVARDVITPQNIGEILAAGAVNPAAGAAVLAGKLATSATQLVTPATVGSGMNRISSEIEHTVGSDEGLQQLAADMGMSSQAHGMYDETPFSSTGQTPSGVAQQWAVAAADDVAESRGMGTTGRSDIAQLDRIDQLQQGGETATSGGGATEQELDPEALNDALAQVT